MRKLLPSPATAARPVTLPAQPLGNLAKVQCRCAQRAIPSCHHSSRAETSSVQALRRARSVRAARAFSKASPLTLVNHHAPPPHPQPPRSWAATHGAHLQRLRGKQHVGVWTGALRSSKHQSSLEMACAAASPATTEMGCHAWCAPPAPQRQATRWCLDWRAAQLQAPVILGDGVRRRIPAHHSHTCTSFMCASGRGPAETETSATIRARGCTAPLRTAMTAPLTQPRGVGLER